MKTEYRKFEIRIEKFKFYLDMDKDLCGMLGCDFTPGVKVIAPGTINMEVVEKSVRERLQSFFADKDNNLSDLGIVITQLEKDKLKNE